MKSSAKNITLTPVDELFSTEESRNEAKKEKIQEISLTALHPFKDHPFRVVDDEAMADTVRSIKEYGVLVPIIARPLSDSGYEIVSGHRRCHASILAGKETIPTIIRDLDDDEATIIMVDSNLQRENILPSERAKAYKMKMDAIRRKAGRPCLNNSCQIGTNYLGIRSDSIIAQNTGDSPRTVQRYIRLTNLVPGLLDMVDDKKLNFNSAVEISYLPEEEQNLLVETIGTEGRSPSISQAQEIRKLSQQKALNDDSLVEIIDRKPEDPRTRQAIPSVSQKQPEDDGSVTLTKEEICKFFPNQNPSDSKNKILRILDAWYRRTQEKAEMMKHQQSR